MGNLGGNPDNVARRKFLPDTALDGAIALLMRRDGFTIQQRATHDESRGARLHEENVDLSFMQFRLTVGIAVNQDEVFVGKILELIDGKTMGISGGLRAQCLG